MKLLDEQNNYLFESSWEVCNKVGGIYSVISSKAEQIKKRKQEIKMLERLRSVRVVLGEDETVITAYHLKRNIEKSIIRGTYKYKHDKQ